jgi:hypothetical protein
MTPEAVVPGSTADASQEALNFDAHRLKTQWHRLGQDTRLVSREEAGLQNDGFPLTDLELDVVLVRFGDGSRGEKVKVWIEKGSSCEARVEQGRCGSKAVGSIDFDAGASEDSTLLCRDHFKPVWITMEKEAHERSWDSTFSINGHGRS